MKLVKILNKYRGCNINNQLRIILNQAVNNSNNKQTNKIVVQINKAKIALKK